MYSPWYDHDMIMAWESWIIHDQKEKSMSMPWSPWSLLQRNQDTIYPTNLINDDLEIMGK